jgi:RimJ/RimL family protein N-acetyltransferase
MSAMERETERLRLVGKTRAEALAALDQMTPETRAQVSAAWLALVEGSEAEDMWVHGFAIVQRSDGKPVGMCGFKGPPDREGMVEIAYGVEPAQENKGYATEAAGALVGIAMECGKVRIVRAHTLPLANASSRVLTKCGFRKVGEVVDPEDGLVWRWEKP